MTPRFVHMHSWGLFWLLLVLLHTPVGTGLAEVGLGVETKIGPHTIRIRQAILADVPSLQRINLVCLPENYNQHCYWFHILRWPTLIRIAEARVPSCCNTTTTSMGTKISESSEWSVVAYVMAKIADAEEIDGGIQQNGTPAPGASVTAGAEPGNTSRPVTGHITSLAVMRSHRRLGLAKRLMRSSLDHMVSDYKAASCALHVRAGNKAALALYRDTLGFHVANTESAYYGDGEDALLMQTNLAPA